MEKQDNIDLNESNMELETLDSQSCTPPKTSTKFTPNNQNQKKNSKNYEEYIECEDNCDEQNYELTEIAKGSGTVIYFCEKTVYKASFHPIVQNKNLQENTINNLSQNQNNIIVNNNEQELVFQDEEIKEEIHSEACFFLLNEFDILEQVSHQNIIKFSNLYQNQLLSNNQPCCIAEMEKMEFDFFEFYIKQIPQKIDNIKSNFAKIIDAVAYLHERDISHNDLRLENMFLKKINFNNQGEAVYEPILGDFGLAMSTQYNCPQQQYQAWYRRELSNFGPEVSQHLQKKENYVVFDEKKSDIFSLGQAIFMAFTKQYPRSCQIPDLQCPIYSKIAEQNLEGFWEKIKGFNDYFQNFEQCKQFLDVCMKMMHNIPEKRPSCKQVLQHPFFNTMQIQI